MSPGSYLLERVSLGKMGNIAVRQYFTLVGATDHITDVLLAQATERLKTEMRTILSQLQDPAPFIDCTLAYHFMEQQSPRVLSDEDRKAIDGIFETLRRFYADDLKTGSFKQAFRPDYTDQEFAEDFGDLPEGIRYGILVEDRAESAVNKIIGFQRYAAWQIKPEKRPGKRTGLERIRTWYKQNPKIKGKQPLVNLQLMEDGFVPAFEYDILMAQGLACELASISRHQTSRKMSQYTDSNEADRRARRGNPQDPLCKPLFQWVFGQSPEDYQGFRDRAENTEWISLDYLHTDLAKVCGPNTYLKSIYKLS
ncbi:MAG: Hypothetical protein C75L2_00140005 [Leptospirillum sp. Group II 'C75']|uniref:Uncharacterized protein n=1 Tax=Leptospirillum sp. Group II '5-way CG' TaxID=419541 RepID=B6AMX7_9BACT|nr:hypothetical protein [Leptospirillum sp. Group II 'CF-1']AKS22497.1 hypothetical protein ABH19_00055 [Leptospirillum sp. Group II 'CF-1']EDZ39825.1 MAG: Hypothetical protein CGL2_11386011 [Leptospirillum sp. Group II '5-way CG']EIJ75871.1 MAG: Hypothetical protein C75L2_00140005 [Leptospirillum sp. Group II 'C75']